MLPAAGFDPDLQPPPGSAETDDPGVAAALALRGQLELCGPVTAIDLATATPLPAGLIAAGLARLRWRASPSAAPSTRAWTASSGARGGS